MDEVKGIAGNRKFMDHYYYYYKLKEQLDSNNCDDRQKAEYDSCQHYLLALNECIQKIQQNCEPNDNMSDYLDYIRWNYGIIKTKLNDYQSKKEAAVMSTLFPMMEICEDCLELITKLNFKLSETDNALVNQYIHAYERAVRADNQNRKVYLHAARLYINYVNLLKNKRFVNSTDRDGVTFTQLDSEAQYLIEKLSNVDRVLVSDIQLANESYADFRDQDSALRAGQDQSIKDSLILAHKRATETFLESALRRINETIKLISKMLQQNINRVMEASSVILNPFLNPFDSAKALVNFVKHPIESAKAIWNYAKENPWKMVGISIGGLLLGACTGGLLTVAAAALIDAAFTSIAITSFSTWAAIGSVGSAVGSLTYSHAVVGSKIVELKTAHDQQIAEQKRLQNSIIEVNDREGEKIARQALYEEHIRESMKQARELAEKEVKRMKLEEENAELERNRQIYALSDEQLNSLQSDITSANQELSTNLNVIKEELYQQRQQSRQMQAKIYRVKEGRSAADSLMEDIAARNRVTDQ